MNVVQNIFGINKSKYRNLGLPEELVSIYRKPKNYRTLKDNLYLIQKSDHLECFHKLIKSNDQGELMYETIIKNLDFVIYEPGKIIYFPKDMITNMFYIFHGSVKVDKTQYDKFNSPKKPKSKSKKKTNYNNQDSDNIITEFFLEENLDENNDFYEMNKFIRRKNSVKNLGFFKKLVKGMRKYKIVKDNKKNFNDDIDNDDIINLEKGDEYGSDEINSTRRKDLVECLTYCVIGFLSKHDWIYIFEKTDILKKNDMLTFLKTLKILKEVSNEVVINNIYNSLKEKHLFRGEPLVKNGENIDKIYIIRKGYFQVNLNIKQKIKNLFNDLNYFGHYTMKEKSENIKYEIKNYYYHDEKYKIVTYGEGEIIGDIEIFLGSKKFLTDVFCNTDSSLVYEISYQDFIMYSNKTMKEALIKEGKQKLKYFRKRIRSIKVINSKKLNNVNRFKEIIYNKLEEEKGEIFNKIENSMNGKYKYEKKKRKKLKSSSVNHKLKEIINQLNTQKEYLNINNNNEYNNKLDSFKNDTKEGRNKFILKLSKESKEEYLIFPTSIKNNNLKLIHSNEITHKDNNVINSDITYSQYIKTTSSQSIKNNYKNKYKYKNSEKTISFLINSSNNNNKFLSGNINYRPFTSNKANNINSLKIKSSKNNIDYTNLKSESISYKRNILSCKKSKPVSLNEKFQRIFTHLFNHKKKRNTSNDDYDSINNLNYYNTQESTLKKINDCSKQNFNTCSQNIINIIKNPSYEDNYVNKIFWSPKIDNTRIAIPLLTEIIKDKKDFLLKRLSTGKNKNYSIKDK